jgi:hypothetical protein
MLNSCFVDSISAIRRTAIAAKLTHRFSEDVRTETLADDRLNGSNGRQEELSPMLQAVFNRITATRALAHRS